ncbi:MAG: gluconate 2-dehydrogenase subunit 3 family protein [Bacteroidota bacterium]
MTHRKIINRRKALKITAYLMGGAVSASLAAGVIGCQTDGTTGDSGGGETPTDGKPAALTDTQNKTVIEATERIIPRTDTPGAKDAKVNEFVDIMMKDILSKEERAGMQAGLDQLEADAQAAHGKSFAECSAAQMDALLEATYEKNPEFFAGLKQLTILGFFTSEVGATQVLAYDKVPTEYIGCIPYEEVGKTWAI